MLYEDKHWVQLLSTVESGKLRRTVYENNRKNSQCSQLHEIPTRKDKSFRFDLLKVVSMKVFVTF